MVEWWFAERELRIEKDWQRSRMASNEERATTTTPIGKYRTEAMYGINKVNTEAIQQNALAHCLSSSSSSTSLRVTTQRVADTRICVKKLFVAEMSNLSGFKSLHNLKHTSDSDAQKQGTVLYLSYALIQ
jgi:hypothetical protein